MPRTSALFDPCTALAWNKCLWADDPLWTWRPSNGNPVSTWRNAGSVTGDAEQLTANLQPLFQSSVAALNGKGAVQFDGVNDYMDCAQFSLVNQFSIAAIANITVPSGCVVAWNNTVANAYYRVDASGVTMRQANGPRLVVTVSAVPYLMWGTYVFAVGGAVQTGLSSVADPATGALGGDEAANFLRLGGRPLDGAVNMAAQYGFVGFYAGDITQDAQWGNFKEWARSYYGVSVARSGT